MIWRTNRLCSYLSGLSTSKRVLLGVLSITFAIQVLRSLLPTSLPPWENLDTSTVPAPSAEEMNLKYAQKYGRVVVPDLSLERCEANPVMEFDGVREAYACPRQIATFRSPRGVVGGTPELTVDCPGNATYSFRSRDPNNYLTSRPRIQYEDTMIGSIIPKGALRTFGFAVLATSGFCTVVFLALDQHACYGRRKVALLALLPPLALLALLWHLFSQRAVYWLESEAVHPYTMPVQLHTDFVFVQCQWNATSTVEEWLVALQPFVLPQWHGPRSPLNVLVLMFDACSRHAFARFFPNFAKSLRSGTFLKTMDVVELTNLNVVGRNSAPNQKAIFCGGPCKWNRMNVFEAFRENGYLTSFTETYSYKYPDFKHNFDLEELQQVFEEFKEGFDPTCYDTAIIKDYIGSLLKQTAQSPAGAGLFHLSTFITTHSFSYKRGIPMDLALSNLMTEMDEGGFLNNTVLFMIADHGYHPNGATYAVWDDFTTEAEHRNPVLFALIGKAVPGRARMLDFLQRNRERLLSHHDIYRTLHELAGSKVASDHPGMNFLGEEIPNERTCNAAGIPPYWCNCWQQK